MSEHHEARAALPGLGKDQAGQAPRLSLKALPFPGLGNGEGQPMKELKYKLYLPPGYGQDASACYPVLYLLHGANGAFEDSGWDAYYPLLDALTAQGAIPPLIAVAPVAGNSYWVDSDRFGPYETAVIKGLISHIDANYSTLADRGHRFIAGFSMGGFGALRYSLVYPQLFEACVLLSPFVQQAEPPATSRAFRGGAFAGADGVFDRALWDSRNYPAALQRYAAQAERVRFFIYATDDDWNHLSAREDLPQDAWKYNMEVQAVLLYAALRRQNPFGADFPKWGEVPGNPAELRIADGGHDVKAWLPGFEEGLRYLFR